MDRWHRAVLRLPENEREIVRAFSPRARALIELVVAPLAVTRFGALLLGGFCVSQTLWLMLGGGLVCLAASGALWLLGAEMVRAVRAQLIAWGDL